MNNWTALVGRAMKTVLLVASLSIYGCEKKPNGSLDGPDDGPSGASKGLFVSFKTPDWSEKVDCSQLSFRPNSCDPPPDNSVYYVYATSASTKMTFQISYPVDSAALGTLATNQRFPLRFNACGAREAMQKAISFMVVIPASKGNTDRWMPIQELNEESYATIKSITYVKSDEHYAYYRVAGSYNQLSALADADRFRISDEDRVISGEFQLLLLTDR
ncbi:hypothetical protein [Parapedobacter sp. 2B3]|uniref:hypothetical protein n=1 Tax=Parapedobacter sp. 2B3 TaxID=3342381 RepID=UPI0035B5BCCE